MSIVAQLPIFPWDKIEATSDLKRLEMVLLNIPDEELMQKMIVAREKGRNEYPIRPVWNSIIAGVVFGHLSIESLRRELERNAELRHVCGFDVCRGMNAVPPAWAYSRFLKNLFKYGTEIDSMFDGLVEELRVYLPELGKNLAVDSKAIRSVGRPVKDKNKKKKRDGRRDIDANIGKKTYRGKHEDGTCWEKVVVWFGYKLHLIVDSTHEIPLAFEVTKASEADVNMLLPIIKELGETHPEIIKKSEYIMGDKAYDSEPHIRELFDKHKITPIIDIRSDWKDGEVTRPLHPDKCDNIVTDVKGTVYCCSKSLSTPGQACIRPMAFRGYEKDRRTLKYVCPAEFYGCDCSEIGEGYNCMGRHLRVKIDDNMRRHPPLPHNSKKRARLYDERTAVERVNSRLDVSFGFEQHYFRGMKKMKTRVGIALVVMLSMALGCIKAGRAEQMRSLVWSAGRLKKAA